jgi:hypothetical protein
VKKLATSFAFEPMCARHLTLGTLLVAANPVRRARDRSHLLTFRQHPCHRWTRRSPPTSIAGGALAAVPIATTAALSPLVGRPDSIAMGREVGFSKSIKKEKTCPFSGPAHPAYGWEGLFFGHSASINELPSLESARLCSLVPASSCGSQCSSGDRQTAVVN